MIKLTDYIVKFFEELGLEHMFMLTGGGCMHLVDSFGKSDKIKYICTHHEQSAAMAGEAYAKFKNDIGLVLVTSGPGATNALTGLLGAYQDSVPVIFLSGQCKRSQTIYKAGIPELRQLGVQEVNIIPVVKSISKEAIFVEDPLKIRYYLERSVFIAKSGRPGPVWLDIPLDVQSAQIDEKELVGICEKEYLKEYKEYPDEEEIDYIVKRLRNAERPVIIAGHGIQLAKANEELRQLVCKYNLPFVTPIMGIEVLESSLSNNIGRIGTKGTRAGNFAMQNADLILSIGSRLSVSVVGHEYNLYAREAEIVVVDIDPFEHQKPTIKIDKFINADAKCFLDSLLVNLQKSDWSTDTSWLEVCLTWKKKYPVTSNRQKDNGVGVDYYKFIDLLSNKTEASVPFISDAGSAFYVTSQAINLKKNQRYITSGALATMGFGLPAAIGVCVANQNSVVVAITGDGSFQQNLQELEILKLHRMPVKLFVMNNNGYLSIHQTQKKFFKENYVGEGPVSGVTFPETSKLAEAYGITYFRIEKLTDLEIYWDQIFQKTGPAIIEVILTREQEVYPTNSALIRPDGTMVSKPLEDMYPFLDREEFVKEMIIKPVQE